MQIDHAAFIPPPGCPPLGQGFASEARSLPSRRTPPAEARAPRRRGQPFRDAETCLVWTIRQLAAEAAGERTAAPTAICAPHEVVKCLDKLYRQRRIDLHHVRILRLWAHRGRAPDQRNPKERGDWRVWRETLDRLEWPLRSLGIVS